MTYQDIYEAFLVMLLAITGIWKAVPLGLVLKLHPITIFAATALGGSISVLILYFFGNMIKTRFLKNSKKRERSKSAQRVRAIFNKYGPAGLGIIGTLIAGQITTVLIGLALVKSQRSFLLWMLVGTVFASLLITLLGVFSVDIFTKLSESLQLF